MLQWPATGGPRMHPMQQVLFLFVLIGAVGFGLARYFDHTSKPATGNAAATNALAMATTPLPEPRQSSSAYRTVTLRSDGLGHFQVEARVDGRHIEFMVDTGASMIALRESSAARIGIHPRMSDYTIKTQTANGIGRAARVRLNYVEIEGITVRDVQAFVVPDEELAANLLGMSFLSRVKWTHDRGRLVLEQ
jgi:aspartyl protease family protein